MIGRSRTPSLSLTEIIEGVSLNRTRLPRRAVNAVLPILVLVVTTVGALFVTGSGDSLTDIIDGADSFSALLWGPLLSVLVAGALSVGQGVLTLSETLDAWLDGVKAMLGVLVILALAWALSDVTHELHAAGYLAHLLGEQLPPALSSALIFLLAAAISFATGTSWGTMGILVPLAVPLARRPARLKASPWKSSSCCFTARSRPPSPGRSGGITPRRSPTRRFWRRRPRSAV